MHEPWKLDASGQAELVRRGEISAAELTEVACARIEAVNPLINAVIETIEPRVTGRGPFLGVPFLVKDLLLELAGTRLTGGSRWLSGNRSTYDDELALRYRRAGLVVVGKTNTCELGLSPTCEPDLHGPTRNPWDLDRSTGGSSGGSAAAVAAGLVPMAHGNDVGGSLRYPAAWCGVFGFKPTRGRVPLGPGHGEIVARLLVQHALTRSVRDSAALLDAVSGPSPGGSNPVQPHDASFAGAARQAPGRLRIAMSPAPRNGRVVDLAWRGAAEKAACLLDELGHVVEEARPDGLDDGAYEAALATVYRAAAGCMFTYWSHRIGRAPHEDEIEPQTRAYMTASERIDAAEYLPAVQTLQRIARRVAKWFETYDAWLTPTVGARPAPLGELVGTRDEPMRGAEAAGRYLMFDAELANVTGNPSMSVPFGVDEGGLPVAVHVLGRHGDEATLFSLAAQIESARPWHQRWPAVSEVSL